MAHSSHLAAKTTMASRLHCGRSVPVHAATRTRAAPHVPILRSTSAPRRNVTKADLPDLGECRSDALASPWAATWRHRTSLQPTMDWSSVWCPLNDQNPQVLACPALCLCAGSACHVCDDSSSHVRRQGDQGRVRSKCGEVRQANEQQHHACPRHLCHPRRRCCVHGLDSHQQGVNTSPGQAVAFW